MATALRRSFPATFASAATVTLGLLALLAADLNSTRDLGPVAAVGVVAALVAMTTLLPALLVLCGRWVFWPFVPRHTDSAGESDIAEDHRGWGRLAQGVARRPRPVWIGTALALAVLTVGASNLSIGLPGSEVYTKDVGSVTGHHLIERHYPAGAAAPAEIVTASSAADDVVSAARGVDGVAEVSVSARSADGRFVRLEAVLEDDPYSKPAEGTVDRIRDAVHAVRGADALVGGETAIQLDTERAASRDNKVVMPLILAIVFLVLVVLLRSLVAPVVLLCSVVLSFAAALGGAGLIFEAIGHTELWYGFPLQAFLFLVALGVDYTIFLVTRAREEASTLGHQRGIVHALGVTGGVITSAGLVLAATFAALAVLPLVPSVQMGIAVAVGVLLDTIIVRSLLVPALALDLGPRFWWPGRLARERGTATTARTAEVTSS